MLNLLKSALKVYNQDCAVSFIALRPISFLDTLAQMSEIMQGLDLT